MIALSREAKALGLKMGGAYHENRDIILKNQVETFSSNYNLYQNISNRVMMLLSEMSSKIEVYSIDEAFLDLSLIGEKELFEHAQNIKETVQKQVGIPVSVGIGRTKVLAKLASELAKKSPRAKGIVCLDRARYEAAALEKTLVHQIWGVGKKLSLKLELLGLKTAQDLCDYPNDKVLHKIGTKKILEIRDELRGISCLSFIVRDKKKNIGSSKSFGKKVFSIVELKEALANYATRAAFKMRSQGSRAKYIAIYLRTNPFDRNSSQYCEGAYLRLEFSTLDTREIISKAWALADEIFLPGYAYKKAGIELSEFEDRDEYQLVLGQKINWSAEKLMDTMDRVNARFGDNTLKVMACGTHNPWKMLSQMKSQRHTTHIFEAPKVRSCI